MAIGIVSVTGPMGAGKSTASEILQDLEYVRQVSVWVGNLIEEQYDTIPMFEAPKKEVILRLVDQINDRFGHHTIRKGYLVDTDKLHTKPNGYGADRFMRKEIAVDKS